MYRISRFLLRILDDSDLLRSGTLGGTLMVWPMAISSDIIFINWLGNPKLELHEVAFIIKKESIVISTHIVLQ